MKMGLDARADPWRLLVGLSLALACSRAEGPEEPDCSAGCDNSHQDAAPLPAGPPPISGGTLSVTRDGTRVIAASPERDRLYVVGLADGLASCPRCGEEPEVLATAVLESGEEPGRMAEDGAGRVHVVLRRGDAVATIDVESGDVLARRPVCPSPRGIAYDPDSDLLHVACASGLLISMLPTTGETVRTVDLDVDLRDVVVVPDGLVVSRFKDGTILKVDHDGTVIDRLEPRGIERGPQDLSDLENDPMEPAVAWRAVGAGDGSVFLLHQYGLARPIDVSTSPAVVTPYAAVTSSRCGGIVAPAVSHLGTDGTLMMGLPLPVLALSVDVAVSSDAGWVAVAHPGATEDRVTIYEAAALPTFDRTPVRCADNAGRLVTPGSPVAVAMIPGRVPGAASDSDFVVVQTEVPAAVAIYNAFAAPRATVALGDDEVPQNRGRSIFHTSTRGGIACAQCHPEGGEDGRVWQFEPHGPRRTQALRTLLSDTAPYHWSGDLDSIDALVDEVFVRRMGGEPLSDDERADLEGWLFSLSLPSPIRSFDDVAAVRGRELFESSEIGCTDCHDGPRVNKPDSVDVGVASPETFQIPSLYGIGYRAPFLHDGCAEDLRGRFEAPCDVQDRHGKTSALTPAQIDDLVAYLESL